MMIVYFVYDVCSVLVQLDIFFHGDKFLCFFSSLLLHKSLSPSVGWSLLHVLQIVVMLPRR